MKPANISTIHPTTAMPHAEKASKSLHPAWRAFIDYCTELDHAEIETLKIQNGLPVLAEVIRKKVKFG